MVTIEHLSHFPDTPGVYLFKKGKEVLYVGKATSLRDRVRSYFSDAAVLSRGQKILKLIDESTTIDFEETDSVLEALIREASLIKHYQPIYNAREKSDTSFNYVVITREEFPRVFTIREREMVMGSDELNAQAIYGPFPHGGQLRAALKIIRKIFPYRGKTDAPAARAPRRASRIYEEIGLAPKGGGLDNPKDYQRTIRHLKMFFEGKKTVLVRTIGSDMKKLARAKQFEEADVLKRRLFALHHINDVALMSENQRDVEAGTFRIEAYDVAHTSGLNVVGVMTVVEGGEPIRSNYRLFTVKGTFGRNTETSPGPVRLINDTAALTEILERRFGHPEWPYPRLIVVDGGIAQQRAAESVLTGLGIQIPIVAVTKNDRHRAERILGEGAIIEKYGSDIILANSEAHRFSIAAHRRKRGKIT